jgi:hypothetical protein
MKWGNKKTISFGFIVILILEIVVISGCIQQTTTPSGAVTATATQTQAAAMPTTTTAVPTVVATTMTYENDKVIITPKTIRKGNVEVTITDADYYGNSDTKTLVITMEVKNVGSNIEYFSPSGLAIVDSAGSQYETFPSQYPHSTVYPGGIVKHAVTFPGIVNHAVTFTPIPGLDRSTKSITSAKLVFELGVSPRYLFEYNINFKKAEVYVSM